CQSGPAFDLPNVQLSVSRTEQQTEDFRLHSRREQFGQRVHMRVYTTQLRGFTTQLGLMTHCDIRIPRGSTRSSYRLDIMVLTAEMKQRLTELDNSYRTACRARRSGPSTEGNKSLRT